MLNTKNDYGQFDFPFGWSSFLEAMHMKQPIIEAGTKVFIIESNRFVTEAEAKLPPKAKPQGAYCSPYDYCCSWGGA